MEHQKNEAEDDRSSGETYEQATREEKKDNHAAGGERVVATLREDIPRANVLGRWKVGLWNSALDENAERK